MRLPTVCSSIKEYECFAVGGVSAAVVALCLGLSSLAAVLFGHVLLGIFVGLIVAFCVKGFCVLEPGSAIVTTFFGKYSSSWRHDGFVWLNPLAGVDRISVKANNLATPTLKVNGAISAA